MSKKETEAVQEEGTFKMKKKPKIKKLNKKDKPIKVDLSKNKKEEDAVPEPSTESVDVRELPKDGQEVGETHVEEQITPQASEEENIQPEEVTDAPIIQEITSEEKEETEEVVADIQEEIEAKPQLELPENVEKLVEFMKDTGGTVEDYVRLNRDYSDVDSDILLLEYYKQTKPHLNFEEINFLMDDEFAWDEDDDEERTIKKKKLALKEEIAKAKNFLEDTKKKYYDEIKLRPGVTQEQQKAMDFFNRYNEEQETVKQRHDAFKDKTKTIFSKDFKGFNFDIGEKKFRYNVNNVNDIVDNQSDLSEFVKRFLDNKGNITDYKGYHKAVYAARNADTIANHFYEQGKADAIKNITAKSKNINVDIRENAPGEVYLNGLRVKAISGVDSSKLKIRTKNK
jgi:uncharacterized protein (DUF2164 family)